MIKITYPGTNNFSTFVYDGLSRNVSIVETPAGSVTSTKMFVWEGGDRKEEHDVSGLVTKKFYELGQLNSTSKYFYGRDHLGSARELTDNTGTIQADYTFDLFGQTTKTNGAQESDFQYASYYVHSRTGLNLTQTRAYNSKFARFNNRDLADDMFDSNPYVYVKNAPVDLIDPSGRGPLEIGQAIGQFLSRIGPALARFSSKLAKSPATEACCEEAESVAPFIRDITLEDLGLKLTGPLEKLGGTIEFTGTALNVNIKIIDGKFESMVPVVPSLVRLAKCQGAEYLNISGTFANETLMLYMQRRYPNMTTAQGIDSISIYIGK